MSALLVVVLAWCVASVLLAFPVAWALGGRYQK